MKKDLPEQLGERLKMALPAKLTERLPALDQSLPSDEVAFAKRFDPMRLAARAMVIVAVLFGGFGTWAAVAPLDSGIVASGTVIVDGRRRLVQHQEGGVIERLLVSEGDHVTRDQVLLRLDETRAGAEFGILRGGYDAALAEEARLIAERDGLTEIVFSKELLDRADLPDVQKIIEGQRKLFSSRRASLTGQSEILSQRIEQSKQEIAGLAAERTSKGRQVTLLQDELSGLRELLAEGLTQKTRVLALERDLEQLTGEQGSIAASIAAIQKSIGETELEILQLQKEQQEQGATAPELT